MIQISGSGEKKPRNLKVTRNVIIKSVAHEDSFSKDYVYIKRTLSQYHVAKIENRNKIDHNGQHIN